MTREKLVRDRIPEVLAGLSIAARFRRVPDAERLPWLLAKLAEECGEVLEEPSVEEIADVLEVLRAVAVQLGVGWDVVEVVRRAKAHERGGFSRGIAMEVEHPGHSSDASSL